MDRLGYEDVSLTVESTQDIKAVFDDAVDNGGFVRRPAACVLSARARNIESVDQKIQRKI